MKGGEAPAPAATVVVGEEHCEAEDRELTVRKTTLFSPGDGLEAYDHRTGALAFRLETYGRGGACGGGAAAGDLALLGAAGDPVLTVRRRRPSLHHRWDGFLGDGGAAGGAKPLFSARRSSILGAGAGVLVDLLAPAHSPAAKEFRVDGSFPRRCCRVVAVASSGGAGEVEEGEDQETVVAEVRRKVDEGAHVVLGRDVFVLWVRAGFDAAFAMGIVLVLGRITGDELDGVLGEELLLEATSPV
ncbi:protein LURP-one-related 5-like [Triticum urartu]|uniref:protein LURP-one-related 5-like n=1 Tax=Triticum dicoccoides TaxID=85692 RepID=UPI00162B16F7|nr:protein LURP-one-related 5-like [Triticum dicoccoides]XP_048545102.1 protein LURP-one-related 5-like [Triticum urartu]